MVEAFVLVQTEVGKAGPIAARITGVDGVISADEVVGGYDVIVRATAENDPDLARTINAIQQVEGITRTLTCQLTSGLASIGPA